MKHLLSKSSRLFSTLFIVMGLFAAALALSPLWGDTRTNRTGKLRSSPVPNATPTAGTLNPIGPTVTWDGFTTVAPVVSVDESTCAEGINCDTYTLTLSGIPAAWAGKKAHIKISWPNAADDFDVFVHKTDNNGPLVGSAANSGAGPEEVELDPSIPSVGTGQFTVHVVYFLVDSGHKYSGEASVVTGVAPTPTPSPGATPTPTPQPPGTPRYHTFVAPPGTGEDAGEPSIGSNWLTENAPRTPPLSYANSNGPIPNGGTTTYYGGFLTEMLRITFDDCSSPAFALWEKKPVTLAATPRALGDPILFTDHGYPALIGPGRTFVSQEEAQAGSTTDFTDNDGDMFMPSQGAGAPAGVDHQTVAAGPYSTNATVVPPGVIPPSAMPYPSTGPRRAVYYASQSVSDARTSRSDDGGLTFGPAVPMYTTADCGGLHGHLKVAPDGTVYVPNNACGGTSDPVGHVDGQQAVIVSENNGLTWSIRKIPTTDTKSDRDPSVGIATDGTIYVGQQSKDGHARISVSHDKGLTWDQFPGQAQLRAYDVGAQLGIQNMVFAEVVAGDPNRAAFAFFGTTTGGTNYDQPDFPGVWYLYIASTFDGGQTWTTINATPNDPIQRGGICGSGTCRNLLDFFDITIDKEGRVLVGGEDGCIGGCVNGGANSFTAKAFITRQSGGKRMLAAFDPIEPAKPGAPAVTAVTTGPSTVKLSWPEPDNGGSIITKYNVYRGTGGTFPVIPTAMVTQPNYTDTAFSSDNSYRVTAVNAIGEGPYCHDVAPTAGPVQTRCVLPGILVINDLDAQGMDTDPPQQTPVDQRVNIKQLFVAEPFISAGVNKLYFTMQVGPSTLGSAPPNSQWFIIWNRQGSPTPDFDRVYGTMRTDAAGTPTFEYGNFGVALDPMNPNPNANTPVKVGDADSGSYDPLTGLIKITISDDKLRMIDDNGMPSAYAAGSDLAGINIRTYFNRPDPGQRSQNNASDITADSSYSLAGNDACAPVPQLVSAVSRKVHGTAGTFDVRLVPTGPNNGIECRSGGGTGAIAGNYQVVMVFASPITFSSATVSAGSITTSTSNNIVTATLSNVPNDQVITITLVGASAGGAATNVSVPMTVVVGDTTANYSVNSTDVSETKSKSGQAVDDENFRNDVTVNGSLNSSDVSLVKSKSGTGVPPPPAAPQVQGGER